jgi:hypothetical protein
MYCARGSITNKHWVGFLKLDDVVDEANQNNLVLEDEEKTFRSSLKACKKWVAIQFSQNR